MKLVRAGFKQFTQKFYVIFFFSFVQAQGVIADHNCTGITLIPSEWIDSAKTKLHIAYGHTSHGSQITDGMNGLVNFANNGGKGLTLPQDIFAWNNGGSDGALDLHDYAMGGDVGYYPDWVDNTKNYLDDTVNNDVNVIIWSWCGQVSGKYANGTLYSEYLEAMNQLEIDYPDVKFVYMTGHLDHWDDINNKAANDSIRNYCRHNNKILFDFADIESYNPNGQFYNFAGDDCSYYSSDGTLLGNWAEEWRASHTENTDWYSCGAAHSDPLNANQKAYAAWWLWATLSGWNESVTSAKIEDNSIYGFKLLQNYPNPFNPATTIKYSIPDLPGFSRQLSGKIPVTLKLYNILGQEMATLVNENQQNGEYAVKFDGSELSSGMYIYRLSAGGRVVSKKMLILK